MPAGTDSGQGDRYGAQRLHNSVLLTFFSPTNFRTKKRTPVPQKPCGKGGLLLSLLLVFGRSLPGVRGRMEVGRACNLPYVG